MPYWDPLASPPDTDPPPLYVAFLGRAFVRAVRAVDPDPAAALTIAADGLVQCPPTHPPTHARTHDAPARAHTHSRKRARRHPALTKRLVPWAPVPSPWPAAPPQSPTQPHAALVRS